jgi:hypothetical protein
MQVHRRSLLLPAVALAIGIPAIAFAQASVEVGPLVAVYAPVGTFNSPDAFSSSLPTRPSDLAGVAWGAEGRLWLTPRVGFAVQGAVATSRFGGGLAAPGCGGATPSTCGFGTSPNHARVVTLTAQVLYRPAPSGFPLQLSAGAGVVRHGGDAYAGLNAPSPVAGVFGLGFDLHIGRWLTATLGVTTLVYALDVRDNFGQRLERGFQIDLLPQVALAWRSRLE